MWSIVAVVVVVMVFVVVVVVMVFVVVVVVELKVDATPMEGYDPKLFDEVLGLSEKGLHASVIISLGYRDAENDFLVSMPKARLPISEFATKIK